MPNVHPFHLRAGAPLLALLLCLCTAHLDAQEVTTDQNFIRVDQFGYLPNSSKVAVLARAVRGYNAGAGLQLDPGTPVQLIRTADGEVVYSSYAHEWLGGSTDNLSGDRGSWFDFTDFTTPGDYRIRATLLDGTTVESYGFRVADDVYHAPLRAALQMFFYQRINQNKPARYASGEPWTDGPWYDDADQEYAVKWLGDPSVTRDLHGGWFDAGDPNKYVTFAAPAVHALLTTYDQHAAFYDTFDLNIPESNNDIPDLLDEVLFEIDWLKRMQYYEDPAQADYGGFIQKMGIRDDDEYISPPSTDQRDRWFNGVCPNATVIGAGMLAHAAVSLRSADLLPEEVAELTARAELAWDYYRASPNPQAQCDDRTIKAGDADGDGGHYSTEIAAHAVTTAAYLFSLTGAEEYDLFVRNNYTRTRPWQATDWGVYRADQAEGVMFYATLPNAHEETRRAILRRKTSDEKSDGSNYRVLEGDNLYRAKPIYFNWGSNSLISRQGSDMMDLVQYDLRPELHEAYAERTQSIINFLHGTNPSGLCMLSNMYQYGAEICADEMWHSWFAAGTRFDNKSGDNVGPAPGYLMGGPNPQGQGNMVIKLGTHSFDATVSGQPNQKAFSVDNNWRMGPWAYNEPAIYYNAGYVKMLSHFADAANLPPGSTDNGFGSLLGCGEAEDLLLPEGSTAIIRDDVVGATAGGAVELAIVGDVAWMHFDAPGSGQRDLGIRVRTGDTTDPQVLAERYEFILDGEEVTAVLDASTLTSDRGGLVWGELVLVDVALNGQEEHVLTVASEAANLFVDRVCWRAANSIVAGNDGGGSGGEPTIIDGIAFGCGEAEADFRVANETGGNSAVRIDDFTPGAEGGQYLNLFDNGDAAALPFTTDSTGRYVFRVRVRVGESSGTEDNLASLYTLSIDGQEVATALDPATISELFDDTYWGDIFTDPVALEAGDHIATVRADRDWLKLDRFCFGAVQTTSTRDANYLPARLTTYPNPTTGLLTVALDYATNAGELQLDLYDRTGRRVASTPHRLTGGRSHQIQLDYRGLRLAAGVYYLRLTTAEGYLGAPQRIVLR